jgi:hypothetical protein
MTASWNISPYSPAEATDVSEALTDSIIRVIRQL